MRRTHLLTITISLATVASFSTEAGAVTGDPGGGYESQQGIYLHGAVGPFADGEPDIPFQGAKKDERGLTIRLEAGELIGISAGTQLRGQELVGTLFKVTKGGDEYLLRINAASKHQNIYTDQLSGWAYDVRWTLAGKRALGTTDDKLCSDGYEALAVPGSWSSGQLQADPHVFTFACAPKGGRKQCSNAGIIPVLNVPRAISLDPHFSTCDGGVIAKCIDYGYAPWVNTPALLRNNRLGQIFLLQNNEQTALQLHNLCTVAMRADYAGNGRTNTIEGTPVQLFDATNALHLLKLKSPSLNSIEDLLRKIPPILDQPRGQPGALILEGVWTLDSTGRAYAICLEKTRWENIELLAPSTQNCSVPASVCGGPHNSTACSATSVPILLSYSAHMDRVLYRFSSGEFNITTTRVVKSDGSHVQPDPRVFCPTLARTAANPCRCPDQYHVVSQVVILSPDLAKLYEKFRGHDNLFKNLSHLRTYRNRDCHTVTATDQAHFPRTSPLLVDEGYLLGIPPDTHQEGGLRFDDLKLILSQTGSDFITAVPDAHGAVEPNATTPGQVLGYVLARNTTPRFRSHQQLLNVLTSQPAADSQHPGAAPPTSPPTQAGAPAPPR